MKSLESIEIETLLDQLKAVSIKIAKLQGMNLKIEIDVSVQQESAKLKLTQFFY